MYGCQNIDVYIIRSCFQNIQTLSETANVKAKVPKTTPRVHVPAAQSDYYRDNKDKLNESLLEEKLTRENYKEKFHQLLCWEEKEHEEQLKRY